jgi:hypothetical protein
MTSDLDIYRSANLLLQQYGTAEAPFIAASRADALLELGDLDGQRVASTASLSSSEPAAPAWRSTT